MAIRRVLTEPPWSSREPAEGELVLRGRTASELWGFGQHPSTSLCLSILCGLYSEDGPRPQRAIELACGSGLLCVAAAKLGAASVIGVEEDAAARELTEENARRNGAHVRAQSGFADLEGDLALANLDAAQLLARAGEIAKLAPRGHLLAAGFVEEEREEVEQRFLALGFRLLYREAREGFIATVFKARAGDARASA